MRAKYRPSERRRNEILSNADSVRYADIPPPFPTITQINYPIVGRVASGRAPTTASTSKNPMSGPTATTSAPVAGPSNHRGPPTASTSSLPMSGPPATTSSAGIGAPPTAAKSHVVGSSDGSTSLGARFAVDPFPRFGEYPIYALVSDADGRLHPQPRPPCRPELPERDESRDILFSRKLALGDVVGWFNEPKALYEQRVTEKLIGRREFEDGPPVREEDVDCDTLGVVWVVGEGGYLAAMMDDAGGFHKTINFTTQAPNFPEGGTFLDVYGKHFQEGVRIIANVYAWTEEHFRILMSPGVRVFFSRPGAEINFTMTPAVAEKARPHLEQVVKHHRILNASVGGDVDTPLATVTSVVHDIPTTQHGKEIISSSPDSSLFMATYSSANASAQGYGTRVTEKSPQCSKETGVTYCLHIASKAAEEIMQIESDFRLSLLQQGRIVDNTDAAFRNPIGQKNEEELGRLEIKTVNQKKTIRRTYNKTLANASKPLPPTTTRAPPFPSFNLDATTSAFGEMKLEPRKLDRSKYNEKCDVMVLCLQCGVVGYGNRKNHRAFHPYPRSVTCPLRGQIPAGSLQMEREDAVDIICLVEQFRTDLYGAKSFKLLHNFYANSPAGDLHGYTEIRTAIRKYLKSDPRLREHPQFEYVQGLVDSDTQNQISTALRSVFPPEIFLGVTQNNRKRKGTGGAVLFMKKFESLAKSDFMDRTNSRSTATWTATVSKVIDQDSPPAKKRRILITSDSESESHLKTAKVADFDFSNDHDTEDSEGGEGSEGDHGRREFINEAFAERIVGELEREDAENEQRKRREQMEQVRREERRRKERDEVSEDEEYEAGADRIDS